MAGAVIDHSEGKDHAFTKYSRINNLAQGGLPQNFRAVTLPLEVGTAGTHRIKRPQQAGGCRWSLTQRGDCGKKVGRVARKL